MITGRAWRHMPLAIWLEFFGSAKRGAFRKRRRMGKWSTTGRGHILREGALEVLLESPCRVAVESRRYDMLMRNLPRLTERELQRMPPRTMYLVVQMMLRTGRRDKALDITKSYLKGLPPKIGDNWARACLNLIHLHISFPYRCRGLAAHHKMRKTCNTLLALHPWLRPNSTTVLLLLRSLRRTKRCGVLAAHFVDRTVKHWGPGMEDQRVRRRVISLALKEGRMDIAERVMKRECSARWSRQMLRLKREVVGVRYKPKERLLRVRDRKLYGKNGRELGRWKNIGWKVKQKGEVTAAREKVFTKLGGEITKVKLTVAGAAGLACARSLNFL